MNKTIFVVAAHPDDELLGSGGTLAAHAEDGDDVFCFILGEGATSRDASTPIQVAALEQQARQAGSIIGFRDINFGHFPDNMFDTVSLLSLTKAVESMIEKIKPDVVYTHHEHDLNGDHRLTFQAVLTACRPCNAHCPTELYTFETLSSTEWQTKDNKQFSPNVYVNIEHTLEKKITALQQYAGEIRAYPHSRSEEGIRILAAYRGLESSMTCAEAFRLIRKIDR